MTISKKTIIEFINNDEYAANEIDFINILHRSFYDSKIHYAFSVNEVSFYKYSETLKFWKKTKIEEVEKEVWGAYTKAIRSLVLSKKTLYEVNKVKTNFVFNMTLERIKKYVRSFGMLSKSMPDTTSAQYIPLQNGYIDLKTLDFNPIDKNIFNRYVLPFEYKENTKEPELFLKFIEQIQPNKEHREFLLNWLAYMLVPSNPRQKSLFMLGAGRNGKGVLTRIMNAILGAGNTSSLTIPQISAETYHIATITNSLVNFSPDNDPNDKLHIGTFKALTGGDIITVRNIRGEPFEMNFLGKLVFSVNKMPYFSSKDNAVLERVEILQFPNIISEKNRIYDLENKILSDGGNELFMFLLNRARKLSEIGFSFKAPSDIREFSRLAVEENDSVFDFLETLLSSLSTREIYKYTELYKDYKEHCFESSFKPLNKVSFKESILMHSVKRDDIDIEFKRSGDFGNHFIFKKKIVDIPIVYETINENGVLVDKNGNEIF